MYSCNKPTDSFKPIDIQVDLKDDVSPLGGFFSIPGEFDLVEWTFEEIYSPPQHSPNPVFYVFRTKGTTTVKVTAYRNEPREKFQAIKEIVIPDVAKKLKISGFFLKNLPGAHPFTQKTLSVSLNYLKYGKSNPLTFTISPTSLSPNDTIFFKNPITIDLNNFFEEDDADNILYLTISENYRMLYHANVFLKTHYIGTHPYTPDYIQLNNGIIHDAQDLFLLTDWMPN